MAGAAVSGFVDGLFKGIGARQGWEDRKRNIKREARQDEIRDNVDRRAEEEHQRRIGSLDRSLADWDRARADDDFYRKTYADAAAAASAGMGAAPIQAPAQPQQPTTQVSTKDDPAAAPVVSPAEGVAMELGIDPRAVKQNRGAAMMERLSPADKLAAAADAAVVTPRRAGSEGPQAAIDAAPARQPAQAAPQPRQRLQFLPDGTAVAPAPSAAIADELGAVQQGPQGVRYIPAPQQTAPARQDPRISPAAQAEMVRQGIVESPTLPLELRRQAEGRNSLPAPSDRVQPQGSPRAPGVVTSPQGRAAMGALSDAFQQSVTPTAPAAVPPPSIPLKSAATPVEKQAAATAVDTLDSTASPQTKDATVAATQAMGVKPGQATIKPQQYERGSKAFIDHYMEVGAPKILEAYISRGDFAKAEAFQQFMQANETRAGMKDWAMAAAAATLGDIDKFGTHIISAYNRMGYFPDGTELVESESGFTKGKDGQVNGAKLTFKDVNTGNTFEQVFNGPDDLVKTGITLLAPENAFEFYWKEQQAAAENAKGAFTAADKAAGEAQKMAIDIAKQIVETSKDQLGNPTKDFQTALREAEAILSGQNLQSAVGGATGAFGPAPSGPPVAYRPQGN